MSGLESFWAGLPVLVTVESDGSVRLLVDVSEAGTAGAYDGPVTDAFLAVVDGALMNGRVSVGVL